MTPRSVHSILLRVAALWLAVGLAACTTTLPDPKLDPPDATFMGLGRLLAEEPTRKMDLFVVHGMCHHDGGWADAWLERMSKLTGSTPHSKKRPPDSPPAEIKVYSATLPLPQAGSGAEIRFHAVVWSGLTKPHKDRLCYDQTNKSASCQTAAPAARPAYPYPRARLNAALKDDLLNDCFSDAIAYLGASRPAIIGQMQEALLQARSDALPTTEVQRQGVAKAASQNPAGLVVLSSSLGSKVVFDAMLELTKSSAPELREAGFRLRNSTRGVFMAANQIPLLSLADLGMTGQPASTLSTQRSQPGQFAPDPLEALFGNPGPALMGVAPAPPPPKPKVVAFTDPNDLLSYTTRTYLGAAPGERSYDMVDVVSSNAGTFLGLFENPYKAHTAYLDNTNVADLLFCGKPRWSRCP